MKTSIEKETIKNKNYRKVLITTPELQVVVMDILPEQEIGFEVHKKTTQFIRIEEGTGVAIINNKKIILKTGDAIVIPKKTNHNIINTNNKQHLKVYTIYSPPVHDEYCIQKYKEDKEC